MLKDMSVAMRKLRTVFVFFAGFPTYRGEEAAPNRQSQQMLSVIHINKFFLLIHALRLIRWFETVAAL
jgi:hypothetical protein